MKAKDVMRCFRWRAVGYGPMVEIVCFMETVSTPTPMPVIRRRGIAVVEMHNQYSLRSTKLYDLRSINFVFSPRSWKVMGRMRVSNVFIKSKRRKIRTHVHNSDPCHQASTGQMHSRRE